MVSAKLQFTMDVPRDYPTKWSKSEKDKYGITYMWNLKNSTNKLIYKIETDSDKKKKKTQKFMILKNEVGEEG